MCSVPAMTPVVGFCTSFSQALSNVPPRLLRISASLSGRSLAWMIARMATVQDAEEAIHYVAPVGEKAEYVARAMAAVGPYLGDGKTLAA